ncbi:MAG: hypothetical protein HQL26_10530 [Candidatus Omnitrophica bacterium]|nr:hypothetical protein [Candidatus Omnitrophota bacterium]
MEKHVKNGASCKNGSCSSTGVKNMWIIGFSIVLLATLFCAAMFKVKESPLPFQDPNAQNVVVLPGGQQAAYIPPGCATCPTVTQCFPQGTNAAQQAAYIPPGCATCPTVTQCFPQATTGGQQVAFTQPTSAPPIFRDSVMGHRFRGVCENCHIVSPDIAIPMSTTKAPHDYRGVCSNCHVILKK